MSVPSRPLVATVAAFLVLLAGCSEKTEGSPSAGDQSTNPTATTEESTEETTPSESDTAGGLADVQPCDLIDDAGLAALQLSSGEEKTLGEARVCEWRREGATINESFTVIVALYEDLGLADIVGTDIKPLPNVGGHEAASFVAPAGSCGVSLAVGEKSRVDSTANGENQQLGCQLASQVATIVEPKLP
jgi:hypothetical protein